MRVLAGLLAALAVLIAGAMIWYLEPWESEEEDPVEPSAISGEFSGSACRHLAGLAAKLAEREPTPLEFLRDFGKQAAGIRPPPRAYGDLARGGKNQIPGGGFLARFDDGTPGQARHFAGIAVATSFGGGSPTRLISILLRDDPPASADGRLSEEGVGFATQILSGELAVGEAPRWLLEHLCRPGSARRDGG